MLEWEEEIKKKESIAKEIELTLATMTMLTQTPARATKVERSKRWGMTDLIHGTSIKEMIWAEEKMTWPPNNLEVDQEPKANIDSLQAGKTPLNSENDLMNKKGLIWVEFINFQTPSQIFAFKRWNDAKK